MADKITVLLNEIYKAEEALELRRRIQGLITQNQRPAGSGKSDTKSHFFDHRDTVLITYGDMVQQPGERPLQTLRAFLGEHLAGVINTIHILPFYPYSSDDGFSVIDYQAVDPALGDWSDIRAFKNQFGLMFDAVINHISRESTWFQQYLAGQEPYSNYFLSVDPQADLAAVFRPRALPLLTPVETNEGVKHVWTTFSDDQIDLNYGSPDLLIEILALLLFYTHQGADLLRLDAIGFMWKEIGTSSIHRPQTHALIQLMRAFLNEATPHVALVTETNVPHQDNISYFGDGTNEAQMVYNFSLPPLTVHAFHTGNAVYLSEWAAGLDLPSDQVTFFNFTASHDGIGVTPARGLLPDAEIQQMAQRIEALGGYVSYKSNSDGSQTPYELNISFIDALGDPAAPALDETVIARFVASQAIMMALRGVPGVYFHSLFGSRSWREGVEQSGHKRRINRQKLGRQTVESELTHGFRQQVFKRLKALLNVRTAAKAFSPYGVQEVLQLHPAVLAIRRRAAGETIICLHNVSAERVVVTLPAGGRNLINQKAVSNEVTLERYEVAWIKI